MNRKLLIAVWATSGLTTLLFAGYWASYAFALWREQNGGAAPSGAVLLVWAIGAAVLAAIIVLAGVGLAGRLRFTGLRRRFPGASIALIRPRGLEAFADAYRLDTARRLDPPPRPLYAWFGPRMLTLLAADGSEVLSFDTVHALLRVEGGRETPGRAEGSGGYSHADGDAGRGDGFGGSDAVVTVHVAGYPRLVLGFPRAGSLGLLQLRRAEVEALLAGTR